jgi:hypothetical protein
LAARVDWIELVDARRPRVGASSGAGAIADESPVARTLELERHELIRLLDALDDEASRHERAHYEARRELGLPPATLSDAAGRARSARLSLENHLED